MKLFNRLYLERSSFKKDGVIGVENCKKNSTKAMALSMAVITMKRTFTLVLLALVLVFFIFSPPIQTLLSVADSHRLLLMLTDLSAEQHHRRSGISPCPEDSFLFW